MKTITLLFFTILLNACSGSKDLATNAKNPNVDTKTSKEHTITSDITKIEYVAVSRGTYNRITILPKTVTTQMSKTNKEVSKSLSNKDWAKLNALAKEINIPGIPNLKAPSVKHQYDGAAGAYFQISIGQKNYKTITFDNGNPPKELEKIIEKLFSFTKSTKNNK